MVTVPLSRLIELLGGELRSAHHMELAEDPLVRDVDLDSRAIEPGTLFAALPGGASDGARFAAQAAERGAPCVLSPGAIQELEESGSCLNWVHPDARRVAGEAAALVHGRPTAGMGLIGVTGTNGKSTVVHLLADLLRHLGHEPGMIGTVEYRLGGGLVLPSTHTTPDAAHIQRLAREHRAGGGDTLCLEVSSHALQQERLAGLELDVAIFTNLGRDHLDYHGDMERYAQAKEKIFACVRPGGVAIVNGDDAASERMQKAARARGLSVITYGTGSRVDLGASSIRVRQSGTHLFLDGMGILRTGSYLPLVGRHNVDNALAALAAVLWLGASPARALAGLASISSPRGRLEPVDTGARGFRVFVDYAHTPEALEHALRTLRELLDEDPSEAGGRLICVFGCGGNRDRDKRPLMGRVAAELADVVLVTSDNPRDEDPETICREIVAGMDSARAEVHLEVERRAAIRRAVRSSVPGDVVLIAGKGHEAWQLLRGERRAFDDVEVAREELP